LFLTEVCCDFEQVAALFLQLQFSYEYYQQWEGHGQWVWGKSLLESAREIIYMKWYWDSLAAWSDWATEEGWKCRWPAAKDEGENKCEGTIGSFPYYYYTSHLLWTVV
jgi:hypothetical protein